MCCEKEFGRRILAELQKLVPEGSRFPVSQLPVLVELKECDEEHGTARMRLGSCEFEEASRYVVRLQRYLQARIPELNHISFTISEVEPNKTPKGTISDPIASFRIETHEQPSVFISYRWGEHDEWVDQFVSDIHAQGIGVIYDRWAKEQRNWKSIDDFLNALLNAMNQCHAFVPIFTPNYLKRAGFIDGAPISGTHGYDGVVFDEFERSLLLSQYKRIETIAVFLDGDTRMLPEPFNEGNILDMRNPGFYDAQVQKFVNYMHNHRAIKSRGPTRGEMKGKNIWFAEEWGER